MEPLLPEDREGKLISLSGEVVRRSERLRGKLHPVSRRKVADLVRSMNSYYSNLIEGHRTKPSDIDTALKREFTGNSDQRSLQQLHWAHVETHRWMEHSLTAIPKPAICSPEFLCQVHREFYTRLPEDMKTVKGTNGESHVIEPGALRSAIVTVGQHVPPAPPSLGKFLARFSEFYGPLVNTTPAGLIAAAAAHHRLARIHPFLDGNGRVTRLFTQAWFQLADISSDGLWTLSRGFARRQDEYRLKLAHADERRLNDFDGRGYLSDRRLTEFCEFVLQTSIDQLDFMHGLLELDGLLARIEALASLRMAAGELPKGASAVLRDVFLRGQIARGEIATLIGASPRTGQNVVRVLLEKGLITSESPKGQLQIAFPASVAAAYFPNLFPAGAE
ncbi:MAG TPA: Fic family protein [Candidatus Limnocylindria bacterium]|jgi:Fic family protein|nr:Fic family protein [Candidatus Limnocylindria bacterium]